MDTRVLAVYTRHYTEIPHLQHSHQVEYTLCESRAGLRLVVCDRGAHPHAVALELPASQEAFARDVLQYLYENAVTAEHARDIVQDLLPLDGGEGWSDAPVPALSAAQRQQESWPLAWTSAR